MTGLNFPPSAASGTSGSYPPVGQFGNFGTIAARLGFRQRLANVKLANSAPGVVTGPRLIGVYADSTGVGSGTGYGTGGIQDGKKRNWIAQMVNFLNAMGMPAQDNSFFGDGNTGYTLAQLSTYDTRIGTPPASPGWVTLDPGANVTQVGYRPITFTNAGSGGYNNASATFPFTPLNPFDSFDFYTDQRGTGSVQINIDGGSPLTPTSGPGTLSSTITMAGSFSSFGQYRYRFTGLPLGTHTINVVATAGLNMSISGIRAFNSTLTYLDVLQFCAYGRQTSDLANATPYCSSRYMPQLFPDLTMIIHGLLTNDETNGVSASTFMTNIGYLLTQSHTGGSSYPSVALLTGPTLANGGVPVATPPLQLPLIAALQQLAAAQNVPFMDIFSLFWQADGQGYGGAGWSGDNVHPNALASVMIGRTMAQNLLLM